MKQLCLFLILFSGNIFLLTVQDSNGYELWLRNVPIGDSEVLNDYQSRWQSVVFESGSETLRVARQELDAGMTGMLGKALPDGKQGNTLVIATENALEKSLQKRLSPFFERIGEEGFIIESLDEGDNTVTVITARTDIGILYGVFRFLQLIRTQAPPGGFSLVESPATHIRMLNHWDNLDRTVERGYAGFSVWDWQKLPDHIDQRYIDYARANASVGINGTALTNVNANALILSPQYLEKVKALADVFRPYGIKVYLTARFSAPIEIGGLKTADPLDPGVRTWWQKKTDEIYSYIPDFGGYLVKANSEGQPGPQNYGRTHADGANMLAEAVAPHNGVVMWRAFVYSEHDPTDRAKQAYDEFVPFDGKFHKNVMIQVKNGAIDFQPREPFHPMFGAMPETPLMMEFQITQEYLGFSTHLVFLPALFQEVLESDTHQQGKGTTVAKVLDGSAQRSALTGMAGVANIGTDINWTGHHFGQANWYGYGRLAWDPYLDSGLIAEEWLRATFSNEKAFVDPMKEMLLQSRESVVNYMTPLGLHHIMDTGHHYGPGPWVDNLSPPEWNPVYYHKADENGIGFDRTATGSNAIAQYAPEVASKFGDPENCPEEFLLWFHHLPWDYRLKDGNTLWDGLALKYQQGVNEVAKMLATWDKMKPYVDAQRFKDVRMHLNIQLKEARWWRDACLLYFQTFSKRPLPKGVEKPEHSLEYYRSFHFPYAPGINPTWH